MSIPLHFGKAAAFLVLHPLLFFWGYVRNREKIEKEKKEQTNQSTARHGSDMDHNNDTSPHKNRSPQNNKIDI